MQCKKWIDGLKNIKHGESEKFLKIQIDENGINMGKQR